MIGIGSVRACLGSVVIVCGCAAGENPGEPGTSVPKNTALSDRGLVTVHVDRRKELGAVKTGGGVVFTGIAGFVPPEHARLDLLGLPNTLNRVHFAGEVPYFETFALDDTYESHWPEPSAGEWNFEWMLKALEPARQIRDRYGNDFILVLHNAPTWMAGNGMGTKPTSIDAYANYCANIVRFFNKGGFVDGGTSVVAPPNTPHVNFWEIWSEPDINDYGGGDESSFTPDEYVEMYKRVTAAMRSVDPTIQIGGPNNVGDFFGPDNNPYVDALVASGERIDFLTYHQYQANSTMDDKLVNYPKVTGIPIVVSEGNIDSNDRLKRAAGPFEAAAMSLVYKRHVEAGTYRFIRWQSYGAGYNVIDALTGLPTLSYWSYAGFWKAIEVGSTRVECTSDSPEVDCLAVTKDGKLRVVVVNRGVEHPESDKGASGVRVSILLTADDAIAGDALVVDRRTDPANGPSPVPFGGSNVAIDGYGMATFWEAR